MRPHAKEHRSGPGRPSARDAACRAIVTALERRGFVSDELQRMYAHGLHGRDAALAAEIALGTIRRLISIEHVLTRTASYQPRHAGPKLRAILASAAYQIIWLDRVPEFAAVDEAVSSAGRMCGAGASRMVNAVLRRLTAAIAERRTSWARLDPRQMRVAWDQACRFSQAVLPEQGPSPHLEHLAAAAAERPRRLENWADRIGPEQAEAIAWASQAAPPIVLQPNLLRCTTADAQAQLKTGFGEDVATDEVGRGFLYRAGPIAGSPLLRDGLFYVQDVTAQTCALAGAPQPGARVLDLCAAPGGKSIALALAMQDQGEIIACDPDPLRLARLEDNVRRLGLRSVHATQIPADAESLAHLGDFDLALVDAPCSNTGVIARRPEARFAQHAERLDTLTRIQSALLHKASAVVRRGGRLVYSTCSIETRENEDIVRNFRAEHSGWESASQVTHWPRWTAQAIDWRDGGFVAVLRRLV